LAKLPKQTCLDAFFAQLKQLQAEIVAIKATNAKTPDTRDYSEARTRDLFIDLLLKEAGWAMVTWCRRCRVGAAEVRA